MSNDEIIFETSKLIIEARNFINTNEITKGLNLFEKIIELRKKNYLQNNKKENLIFLISVFAELFNLWAKFGNPNHKTLTDVEEVFSERGKYQHKSITLTNFLNQFDKEKKMDWKKLAYEQMFQSIKIFGCRLPVFNNYMLNKCPKYQKYCKTNPLSGFYSSPAYSYVLFCEECGVPLTDEKCMHDVNDECIKATNLVVDHVGLVHNPEMEETGICVIALPLDMVLEKEDIEFQSLFKKNPNRYDIACQICNIENLQLDDIEIENWLFHRGIDQSWVSDFIEKFDIHLPIYNDKEYTKKEFKDVYNNEAKGILILGTIPTS